MIASIHELFKAFSGGQFEPVYTGQFKPVSGGQFKSVGGGQFHRFLHAAPKNVLQNSFLRARMQLYCFLGLWEAKFALTNFLSK